jgi:cathepsin X
MSATSAMSDRIKILRKAKWPDIYIAPQVLLSCENISNGCGGGYHMRAFKWIEENNITDETCSIYQSRGRKNGLTCSAEIKC